MQLIRKKLKRRNSMEDNKNILDKWFEFREEELESGLTREDKNHIYDFEKCTNAILEIVDREIYNYVRKELNKLEEQILRSMEHFNKKYYMAGFMDALEILLKI